MSLHTSVKDKQRLNELFNGKYNSLNDIIAFEEGSITEENFFRLFSYLIKTGQVWELQGFYGRTARDLIEAGQIDRNGNILEDL